MAKMVGEIIGLEDTLTALREFGDAGEREARKALLASAHHCRTLAIQSIQAHESKGVTYAKENPNREHTASAPFNPPNTDTGALVRSIVMPRKIPGGYIVGSALPYAMYLEFGTRRMAERPWLRPALKKTIPFMRTKMRDALRAALAESLK